jgi:hypothetical protein
MEFLKRPAMMLERAAKSSTMALRVHILLVLLAVAMLFVYAFKAHAVVSDVLNWAVLVLLAIHAVGIWLDKESGGSHKVLAMVLVLFALVNAVWHQIEGNTEGTAAMGGFVAGAIVFSFFVFHKTPRIDLAARTA